MPSGSIFARLPEPDRRPVTLFFEGEPVGALQGDSVAAALLAAGKLTFRATPVGGAPRGPYCMMGVCFECLLEIDGVANRQGCMVQAADGMRVSRMLGARGLADSNGPAR